MPATGTCGPCARGEIGSAFDARFFDNRTLRWSLAGALAIGVASTFLLLDDSRKLAARAFRKRDRDGTAASRRRHRQ